MKNQFEYTGVWWLPENSDNKISGTLKFNPIEGIDLELIGAFKGLKDIKTMLQPKIILGISSNGKIITLHDCFEYHSRHARFLTSSFVVNVIFEGHHFEKEEDIIFDSLSINYSQLEEWTGISGFQIDTETDANHHLIKHEVIYEPPQKIEVNLDNLKISVNSDFSYNWRGIDDVNLKQTTFIKMEPDKPTHYNDFQKNICYHIQNFLSLAIGKATHSLTTKGKIMVAKDNSPDGSVEQKKILIFYSEEGLPDSSKPIRSSDMLFVFEDISDNFENCLKNWITKSDYLQPVYDLYFGTLYNSSMYIQHEFLSLIQALETYHRRTHHDEYIPKDDYAQKCKTLIETIPEVDKKFRNRVIQKLMQPNELSLRKRLTEIYTKCNKLTKLSMPNEDDFIKDVVYNRNFLTHYDKKKESKAKTDQELYNLVQKMKFLLEICFLIELEMTKEKVETLVSRNRRYQFVINF